MNQFVNFISEYGLYLGVPLAFLGIVAWIYRPSAKNRYRADGNIPFHEDRKDPEAPQGGH
jgi:cbb3-type cytochrome oxidase subunit 3